MGLGDWCLNDCECTCPSQRVSLAGPHGTDWRPTVILARCLWKMAAGGAPCEDGHWASTTSPPPPPARFYGRAWSPSLLNRLNRFPQFKEHLTPVAERVFFFHGPALPCASRVCSPLHPQPGECVCSGALLNVPICTVTPISAGASASPLTPQDRPPTRPWLCFSFCVSGICFLSSWLVSPCLICLVILLLNSIIELYGRI